MFIIIIIIIIIIYHIRIAIIGEEMSIECHINRTCMFKQKQV